MLTRAMKIMAAACLTAVIGAAQADTPVADAAMRGDTQTVRSLLRTGADVNTAQGDGMTALHWAAYKGNAEMARVLIYAGANPRALTRLGDYTPLILAASGGHAAAIEVLLEAGADVNAITSAGATAIHLAAASGSADAVGALLDHGADVNAAESVWEQTPLMFAASSNRTEVIATLIERGADLSLATKVVPIAELSAQASAERRTRNALLAALRDPIEQGGGRGGRGGGGRGGRGGGGRGGRGAAAAQPGAAPGNPDPQAAGQRGRGRRGRADPGAAAAAGAQEPPAGGQRARRGRGQGRAAAAAGQEPPAGGQRGRGRGRRGAGGQDPDPDELQGGGQSQAVRQVSGGGARDSGMGGRGGMTALLHAARQGHIEAVRLLLDAGADINQVHGGDQSSPLMLAAINGHFDLAKYLLERGADPNLTNNVGAAPLYGVVNVQWAPTAFYPQPSTRQEKTTHLELMAALLDAGADPDAQLTGKVWYTGYNFDQSGEDETGATAFWRAAQSGDVDAMRLLVEHGADPNLWNTVIRSFNTRGRRGGRPAESGAAADEPGDVEVFYTAALQERRTTLGDKHPATLAAMHDLGALLQRLGKLEDARRYLLEATEGRRETLGEEHPATAASAAALEALGGAQPAEPVAETGAAPATTISQASAEELRGADPKPEAEPAEEPPDLGPPTPAGGPATSPLNMAAGAGFDGNFHVTAPYGRLPAVRYLVEELGFDVNGRDYRGYTALHHAAFRGDNEMILYLVDKGADPLVVSRSGQTTVDMANGPIQRLQPFEDTIALLEGMGAVNNHRAVSR